MKIQKNSNAEEYKGYYRFGFKGKENEVKFTGNQQDYVMRIYDSRLAGYLSADTLIIHEQ